MKPILKLESDGGFRHSSLTVIATGESIPTTDIGLRFSADGGLVTLTILPDCLQVDIDPGQRDREREEYERLKKKFGKE